MNNSTVCEGEPSSETGQGRKKSKVKVEGAVHRSEAFVDPLYAEQPELVWNRVDPIAKEVFEEKYGLCNKGLPPKRLKYGIHLEEADVEAVFGPRVSNGYRYAYSEDVAFVKKVEYLWMVTHQRTQVPNTRLINAAEAKGLVYEIKKKKDVNWCSHAEWTCRDQLRLINVKKESATKSNNTPIFLADEEDEEADPPGSQFGSLKRTSGAEGTISGAEENASASALRSGDLLAVMAIADWQRVLGVLEKELPTLEGALSRLGEEKDAAKIELVRVSTQVDFGQSLLSAADSKLAALEVEYESWKVKAEASDSATSAECELAAVELSNVQKKIESQKGVIEQFRALFWSGTEDQELALARSSAAEGEFESAKQKLELWRTHRLVLGSQLKGMTYGYQRPTLYPSPLPFLYSDSERNDASKFTLEVGACPFCSKGFEPVWDCKISSCCHPYHSWCAYSHFSKSSKCMYNGCNLEQHEDWWVMAGIKKPEANATEVQVETWDRIRPENVGNDFQDPARTSRSISKNERRPPRSNTTSASVGSFQVPRLPVLKDAADGGLPRHQKQELTFGQQAGANAGNYSSPKRSQGVQKTLQLDDINVQPTVAVFLTQTAVQHGPLTEGQLTPRPKKLQGGDGVSGRNTPKGRKGAQKHHSVAEEELKSMSKKADVCQEESDDEEAGTRSQSGSGRAEVSDDGEADSPVDKARPDEDPTVVAKSASKKKQKRKPILERISVSKKTRSAAKAGR